ncbi:MAG TPA: right-handed parallel beta-helix repeat-containing protein [Thermoanaerobaculia bacterium]|nr:right-handed parallel beta-helix repeat-containing protein [Thermoanaerobaculia bacterium]
MQSLSLRKKRLTARSLPAAILLIVSGCLTAEVAVAAAPGAYDIGTPSVADLWVDPLSGNDSNGGSSRADALRTVAAAINRIPIRQTFSSRGYRLMLLPGTYGRGSVPGYIESRYGTYDFPLIIQSAEGRGKAFLTGDLNLFDMKYFYLIDLDIIPEPAGDVVRCERCDHLLIRGSQLDGGNREARETLKVNRSTNIFIEESTIEGADDNAIDFVSVQYGHVINSQIRNARDWCMYAKGGSAYLRIEGNEISECGAGGFTAGQRTGFQLMVEPWIHYEAYDIKVVNNIIHDVEGAGLGVRGGYNILLAHNTLFRVGARGHMIEVTFGLRSCDGKPGDPGRELCAIYLLDGGWGTTRVSDGNNDVRIPNRNVFIYNNLLYNPAGFSSSRHFLVSPPYSGAAQEDSNVEEVPTRADTNLQIRGNVISNPEGELGIASGTGCGSSNPTCNETRVSMENVVNLVEPQLVYAIANNVRPIEGSNLSRFPPVAIPDFGWGDAPARPAVPVGNLSNAVLRDRDGVSRRPQNAAVGAYVLRVEILPDRNPPTRGRRRATTRR